MSEQNQTPVQKQCIACKESIRADALICPICRSSQRPQRWAILLSVLKWTGGLTAIISLIIGVKQVSGIVKEWRERDEAVERIVVASKMLLKMNDYQAAWLISNKAASIAPNSQKAFDQQVDVALAWVRDIWRQKGSKTYTELIDPLIVTLAQGAGDKDPNRTATVLAHIGWGNLWRNRDDVANYEVASYLRHALKYNVEDTYANLFMGYWMLDHSYEGKYNNKEDDKDRLAEAMAYFAKAENAKNDTEFVNGWMVLALTNCSVAGTDIEAIKLANRWRKDNMASFGQYDFVPINLLSEFKHLYRSQTSEDSILMRLVSELSVQDIKATYIWLTDLVSSNNKNLLKRFYLGLMSEADGDLKSAYDNYVESLSDKEFIRNFGSWGREALCRLIVKCSSQKKSTSNVKIPETAVLVTAIDNQFRIEADEHLIVSALSEGAADDSGLLAGDHLLMIDNKRIISTSAFDQAKQDLLSGKRAHADLLILRGRELRQYRFVAYPDNAHSVTP